MNDTNSNIYNKNALPTYFMPFLHVSTDIPRLMINTIPDSVKCCLAPMTEMRITLYPREIAKRALELASTNILLVHNHPSGDPEPSTADINMTKVLTDTLKPLSITVLDHIIIARDGHASLKGMGLI